MIKSVNTINGQSNIDLNIQLYGGLDNYISFLISNRITNSNTVIPVVTYDTDKIINRNFTGTRYCTSISSKALMNNDGVDLLNNDGEQLLNNI